MKAKNGASLRSALIFLQTSQGEECSTLQIFLSRLSFCNVDLAKCWWQPFDPGRTRSKETKCIASVDKKYAQTHTTGFDMINVGGELFQKFKIYAMIVLFFSWTNSCLVLLRPRSFSKSSPASSLFGSLSTYSYCFWITERYPLCITKLLWRALEKCSACAIPQFLSVVLGDQITCL